MKYQHTIEELRDQLKCWEAKHHRPVVTETISFGCELFDRLLPRGGFVPGQLVEWFGSSFGSGAGTLAWMLALRAARAVLPSETNQHERDRSEVRSKVTDGSATIVVIDEMGTFYPSAAIAWGLRPEQVMIVRPKNSADTMWAIDQALRCSAVAVVWASLQTIEANHFRRMQLAAEEGATLGLLVRPAEAFGQPSWSELQLRVEPLPSNRGSKGSSRSGLKSIPPRNCKASSVEPYWRAWRVEVLRCRGGTAGGSLSLQMQETTGQLLPLTDSHETSTLHLAAELARPANPRRSASA